MSSWTAHDLPDLTGRTVVITGAGRGLGLIAARELARAGARVVLGVRDTDKGRRAVAGLPASSTSGRSTCRIWARCVPSPTPGPGTSTS